ncbi:SGNH/GDSL hydrolase family protein [Actinocrispum sp. NPDC049592]|uniref:SGNH/GDSL hydrolase family protein n=1 Tax=Actinocrispum sp. NPDC049592 TaxID=3154835 RepID=UPI00343ADE34
MTRTRLTALGDSFVEGYGMAAADGWVRLFADLFGLPEESIVNLGRYGATTGDVIDTQLGIALAARTPLIGVMVGANDLLGAYVPEQFRANLATLFSALTGPDTVVFTSTYPRIPRLEAMPRAFRELMTARFFEANECVRELAAATGVLCLDIARSPSWDRPVMWSADGLHPSPDGHRVFADAMADLVATSGGLR